METVNTREFAEILKVTQPYVRWRLHMMGSYYGIKPIKLASGKLRWSKADAEAYMRGEKFE